MCHASAHTVTVEQKMETGRRRENYFRDIEHHTVIYPLIHSILGYRDSVFGIEWLRAGRSTVRTPWASRFSGPIPAHPASLSSGGTAVGKGGDDPPPSKAEVEYR